MIQVPFACPNHPKRRVNLYPWGSPVRCAQCHELLTPADPPVPQPGFIYKDVRYIPQLAGDILASIHPPTNHWRDARRIKPLAIYEYATMMREGRWRNYTMANGMTEHPIRFDSNGELTHGFCRLMAVYVSSTTQTMATYATTDDMELYFDANQK